MGRLRSPQGAVVCVPAHNEAERIGRLLASLAAQTGFGPEGRLGVVVIANGCRDETAAVARGFESSDRLALRVVEIDFPPKEAHVGTARRLALDTGAAWLEEEGMPDGALLTTDADARVGPGWAQANIAALGAAEIVGGALVIDHDGEQDPAMVRLNEDIARYWRSVRALEDRFDPPPHDPSPRHGDHTGGSLALRAATYRAVGGLPAIPSGEDNALVARVVEAGGRLRHDPAVAVMMSDRTVGRASGGMAMDMARRQAVARGEKDYLLPPPAFWLALIERRAALRRAWRAGPEAAGQALRNLGLDAAAIASIGLAGCPNDIAFVERASRLLPEPAKTEPDRPVAETLPLFPALLDGATP